MTIAKILHEVEKDLEPTTALDKYRPKTITESVEKTGDIMADSVTAMHRRLAEEVRAGAQRVVDEVLAMQKEADRFATDIITTGEKQAQDLLKASKQVKYFLEMLAAQKPAFKRPE